MQWSACVRDRHDRSVRLIEQKKVTLCAMDATTESTDDEEVVMGAGRVVRIKSSTFSLFFDDPVRRIEITTLNLSRQSSAKPESLSV